MSNLAVAVLNAVVWGMIMALIALGLNMIFGLLHIINMAHGALYMLGA
ncbi:MAG: ABC transporter permease subunit, partial [Thermodesulfobacteriota bacterium]